MASRRRPPRARRGGYFEDVARRRVSRGTLANRAKQQRRLQRHRWGAGAWHDTATRTDRRTAKEIAKLCQWQISRPLQYAGKQCAVNAAKCLPKSVQSSTTGLPTNTGAVKNLTRESLGITVKDCRKPRPRKKVHVSAPEVGTHLRATGVEKKWL